MAHEKEKVVWQIEVLIVSFVALCLVKPVTLLAVSLYAL